jgi:hypothetical protein
MCITQPECVIVAFRIKHVMRTIFEKKNLLTKNAPFDFLYNFCPKYFSF